jgi:hypothetical protein
MDKIFYFSDELAGYVERVPVYYADHLRTEQTADMLKRNAVAYVAYPHLRLKLQYAIELCFPAKGKTLRHPGHDGKDTSRDMVIPPIAVLYALGEKKKAAELAAKVNYRISARYTCTPSLWFWLKYIQYGHKVYLWLFLVLFYAEHIPVIAYTRLICKLCGVTDTAHIVQDKAMFDPLLQRQPWLKRQLLRTTYPGFALFLSSLMFWGVGKKSRYMINYTRNRDRTNYVVRHFFGEDLMFYFPPPPAMNDVRQEVHFDQTNDRTFRPVSAENNLSIDFHNAVFNIK